jgi:hypothetical protein
MIDPEEYASPACWLHEADPAYADPKFTDAEIRDALIALHGAIDPAREEVIDSLAGWIGRLGGDPAAAPAEAVPGDPITLFDRLLPRIADPALHQDLLALRAVYARGGSDALAR